MRIGSKNFLKEDIQFIQEMADTYQALSRKELAYTICENLNWKNEAGNLKVDSCLVLLKKLENTGKGSQKNNLVLLGNFLHIRRYSALRCAEQGKNILDKDKMLWDFLCGKNNKVPTSPITITSPHHKRHP